ncbi:formate/nitrite transporter family protein [Halobium salinum]|uniref:Formate/nitrite transporter family protein n=1 Tax=Halobium salinum TaxID=1364940 RepID=A0ABD5P923_9EURY|nr:formate/nitrite transporter family protein [Halobium salinum]
MSDASPEAGSDGPPEEVGPPMTDGSGMTTQTDKGTILEQLIDQGFEETERSSLGLALSGLSAGLDIGFGPLLMVAVYTLVSEPWGEPLTTLFVANAYAVGFIFVVLGRSELFTEHTTLAALPVIDGRSSISGLARLWALVYAGNIVGGAIFAVPAVLFAPDYGIATPNAFVHLGDTLLGYGNTEFFFAAILAGWMMGLLAWLLSAAQETLSRIVFVWVVTAAIGLLHLPHSIAGNVEIIMAVLAGPKYGLVDYVVFLGLSTAGNAVGGVVFVALLKYGHIAVSR